MFTDSLLVQKLLVHSYIQHVIKRAWVILITRTFHGGNRYIGINMVFVSRCEKMVPVVWTVICLVLPGVVGLKVETFRVPSYDIMTCC